MFSGFYADIADVPVELYKGDALEAAVNSTYKKIKVIDDLRQMTIDESKSKEELRTKIKEEDIDKEGAVLPVWFMSYRKKDRVAYATINGQT